jgi:uncharacterized membrane protein YgcG
MFNNKSSETSVDKIKFTKLGTDGQYKNKWDNNVNNFILTEIGQEMYEFMTEGILPPGHCQSSNFRENIHGTYVNNCMPGNSDIMEEKEIEISKTLYYTMPMSERNGVRLEERDDEDLPRYFEKQMVNSPGEYTAQGDKDPYACPRKKVAQRDLEKATTFERTWVNSLGKLAGLMSSFCDKNLVNILESNESYVNHRKAMRPDLMRADITMMVLTRGECGTKEKVQMDINILLKYNAHMLIECNENQNVIHYLEKVATSKLSLEELGFGECKEKKPEGEDTLDYLFGLRLIVSVGKRFKVEIDDADKQGLLQAPTCTYDWAVAKIKLWNSKTANSFSNMSSKKQNRREDDEHSDKSAKILKTTAKTHDHTPKNNHKNTKTSGSGNSGGRGGGSGGGSGSGSGGGSGGGGSSTTKEQSLDKFKASHACLECGKLGHYASDCPTIGQEKRDKHFQKAMEIVNEKKSKWRKGQQSK